MALTDDQKAMLRLLAQREEGYEDMAAVMGISVEEVRERVREALAEVDQPEAPATPAPAPEPPVAPVATPPAPEVEQTAASTTPTAPPAPQAPAPAAKAAAPGPRAVKRPAKLPKLPGLKMPKDRGALIGLGAGALVVVILVIVLIVGGDGGGSDSTTTSSDSGSGATTNAAAENESLTQAILSPVNGGDAAGRALFGTYKKNVLLQVEAEGLEPSSQGQSYAIWLYSSPKVALRIGAVNVGEAGKIATQLPVPTQLLRYVAGGAFDQIDISLTSNAVYKAELVRAKREKSLPAYTGESILRGEITGPAIQ